MNKILLLLLLYFLLGATDTGFVTYHNDRFNYQIDYPNFLQPQGEAENGDGQIIKDSHSKIIVYGSYFPENIDESYKNALAEVKNYKLSYNQKNKNDFVLSGENKTQIFYFKTIFVCGENINVQIYYPKTEKKKWDAIVNRISHSFKYASSKCLQ